MHLDMDCYVSQTTWNVASDVKVAAHVVLWQTEAEVKVVASLLARAEIGIVVGHYYFLNSYHYEDLAWILLTFGYYY